MPEAVGGYPRWRGELSRAPRMITVATHEVRRGINDQWARAALIFAFGYAGIRLLFLVSAAKSNPSAHSMDAFLSDIQLLPWAALAVAAVVAGPALLEDAQRGALELYLSRALTRREYLSGKILAVFALTLVAVLGPALLYIFGTFVMIDKHPDGWAWAPLSALGYSAIWAFVVSGLGLGLSCVARSSRGATLLLLGGVATLDLLIGAILSLITQSTAVQVISPLADLQRQVTWLFSGASSKLQFDMWVGLGALGTFAALGWAAVWLRHPRLKGVE